MEKKQKKEMKKWLIKALDFADENPKEWNILAKEIFKERKQK